MEKKQKGSSAAAVADEQPKAAAPLLGKDEIAKEVKPLSSNGFIAFWQGLWRSWLGIWYGFADKHPKGSKLIYMVVFFLVFSNGVTIWQFLVMLFLPYAFQGIWSVPFCWPAVALPWIDALGNPLNYAIFNEPVKFLVGEEVTLAWTAEQVEANMALGKELQMSGLGNFIAFEIAVFTAQCINLPLQRNITFKSKGNWVYQAMWYFIGWVGISIGVNALWGIMNPLMLWWNWPDAGIALLKTVITGGISMAVFFPIFLIIFPDVNAAVKRAQKKVDTLKANNTDAEKLSAAELNLIKAIETARLYNARTGESKIISVASTRAVSYLASLKNATAADAAADKLAADGADPAAVADAKQNAEATKGRIAQYQQQASDAIAAKYEAITENTNAIKEVTAARAARGEDANGKKIAA